jgi:hypothetical protein
MHLVETSGSTAVVQEDDQQTVGPLGPQRSSHRYTVDRSTLENVASAQAYAFAPGNVVDRSPAFSVSFPFDAGHGAFLLWDDRIGQAYPLRYTGAGSVDRLSVNRYSGSFAATAVQPAFLAQLTAAGLPVSVTFDQLRAQLAAEGTSLDQFVNTGLRQLDQGDQRAVNDILNRPISLTYDLATDTSVAVEPRTGTIVSVNRARDVVTERPELTGLNRIYAIMTQPKYAGKPDVGTAAATLAKLSNAVPATQVLRQTYAETADSTATVAALARAWANRITVWTVILPLVLGGLGVLLAATSAVWLSRGRRLGGRSRTDRTPR